MPKTYIPRRPKISPHLAITNPLSVSFMSEHEIKPALASFFARSTIAEFRQHIAKLIIHPKTRKAFGANSRSLIDIGECTYYALDEAKSLILYLEEIKSHREDIIQFLGSRRTLETNVLMGNYEKAATQLKEIREKFGNSFWELRTEILLLHLQEQTEELQRFTESSRAALENSFVSYLTNNSLIVTTNPALHLNRTVRATIKEFAKANHNQWADLVALTLVPQWPVADCDKLDCLVTLQIFPVIDQYLLLRSLISHNLALDEHKFSPLYKTLLDLIIDIDESARQRGGFSDLFCRDDLISIYEKGDYPEFLSRARKELPLQWRPFNIANLLAKATAIIGEPDSTGAPLDSYLGCLRAIYDLTSQPNAFEEKAYGLLAVFNHFADSYDMEVGLVKTMPLRFAPSNRSWAARRNALYYGRQTGWELALSHMESPLLSHKYITTSDKLPQARKTKKKIIDNINGFLAGTSLPSEPKELIEEYRASAPLLRDFFELSSSLLQATRDLAGLTETCSIALAHKPGTYTAFPLAAIAHYIEEQRIASLDALVVIYFYAKYLDKKKEYLLNEIFEEYLLLNGATKPSDLLDFSEDALKDPRMDLLFAEVSTLETMDFLGCFDSSSDLGAERVRILDHLRSTGKISPEVHGSEVDEILSRIVVDTTATEFNVAKIDVNDDAIRRDIYDDVDSLLAVYKTHRADKVDRVITFEGDGSSGSEPLALVVGDKGSALHKIVDLITRSFVGDEKHGLAKNLSAEVRHGFFSNQMRSRLEEAHLLTERDSHGDYQSNRYWLDRYDFVADDLMRDVDQELRWFSEAFNELVAKAEEWMKIATAATESERRLFRYDTIPFTELEYIKEAAESGETEAVMDRVFEGLWNKTEATLYELRRRLNSEFRAEVDQLFEELLTRIDHARRGAPLADLIETVQNSRGGLHEDLTTISEWFRRTNSEVAEERTVQELILISIECLNRVRGSQISPTLDIDPSVGRNMHLTRQVRCFIIALVNLLENAIRHSGYGLQTSIQITAKGCEKEWALTMTNEITNERLMELMGGGLERARAKVAEPGNSRLVQTEGGSGLKKVASHLKSIDEKYQITLDVREHLFEVAINYEEPLVS